MDVSTQVHSVAPPFARVVSLRTYFILILLENNRSVFLKQPLKQPNMKYIRLICFWRFCKTVNGLFIKELKYEKTRASFREEL